MHKSLAYRNRIISLQRSIICQDLASEIEEEEEELKEGRSTHRDLRSIANPFGVTRSVKTRARRFDPLRCATSMRLRPESSQYSVPPIQSTDTDLGDTKPDLITGMGSLPLIGDLKMVATSPFVQYISLVRRSTSAEAVSLIWPIGSTDSVYGGTSRMICLMSDIVGKRR